MAGGHQPGTSGDRSEEVLARVLDGLGPADPASAAAYAAAATDLDRIRRALHTIGAEAAKAAPTPAPAPATGAGHVDGRRPTWLRPLALGAAALIALLAGVVGLTRLNGPSDEGGGSEGYHEYYISCASTIVEGDILSTRPAARPGHIVLTLRVRDWLVPSTGPRRTEIEVSVPGPDGAPPARTGQRQLLFVWRDVDRVDRFSGGGIDSDIRKQAWRELLPRAREFSRSQCAEAGAR
jgi:hypothetical protein